MRPRKRLAIFSRDEMTMGVVSFALDLAGFDVSTASTPLELHGIVFYEQPQGLLIIDGQERLYADDILRAAKAEVPDLRTVVVIRKTSRRWQVYHADRVLFQPEIDMAQLRESLKILLARKRGPKGPRSVHIEQEAATA